MILCIETSASYCSIAIAQNEELIALHESNAVNDHASTIMSHIDACLKDAQIAARQLEAIAVSRGPGSFTGLRVGASTAKGLCFALDIPLIGVSTLEALADQALKERTEAEFCVPMIWARKKEVYTAAYDRTGKVIFEEQVVDLIRDWHKTLKGLTDSVVFCGNGSEVYLEIQGENRGKVVDIRHSATNLIGCANSKHIKKDYCVASKFAPSYLKSPHITQPRKVL